MPVRHPARGLFAALAGLSCLAAAGCAASQGAALTAGGQPGSHGASGASGGTPATASTVIPAQLGDTWVYAVNSSVLGKGTETNRISAVTPVAGGQRATLSSSLRLGGSKEPFRFTSFRGAKLVSANVNWPSPAALTPGRPRTSTATGSFLGFKTTERVTVTEVGPAAVTVPAGSYQATLLEQTVTDRAG